MSPKMSSDATVPGTRNLNLPSLIYGSTICTDTNTFGRVGIRVVKEYFNRQEIQLYDNNTAVMGTGFEKGGGALT